MPSKPKYLNVDTIFFQVQYLHLMCTIEIFLQIIIFADCVVIILCPFLVSGNNKINNIIKYT